MADTKITALAAITTVDPAVDVFPIVDVSDTSMAASGTTKKITSNQLLGSGGTATLASATVSGALGAAGLNVTGATLPANGVYLPSANNLGFTYNSTLGMTLNSTGLGVGTSSPGYKVVVAAASGNAMQFENTSDSNRGGRITNTGTAGTGKFGITTTSSGYALSFGIDTVEKMLLDTNGNLILSSSATPSTLATNGQLTVNATSNTNLRFSYRGSDGVTRVANITLA